MDCTDPWHDDQDAPHLEYTIESGVLLMTGWECLTCHMRTVWIDGAVVIDGPHLVT